MQERELVFAKRVGDWFIRNSSIDQIPKLGQSGTHTQQLQGRWDDTQLRWICRLKQGPAGRRGTLQIPTGTAVGAAMVGKHHKAFCMWIFHLSFRASHCTVCSQIAYVPEQYLFQSHFSLNWTFSSLSPFYTKISMNYGCCCLIYGTMIILSGFFLSERTNLSTFY